MPGSAGLREALTKEIENRSCLRQCLGWLWRLVCGLLTLVSHVSSSLSLSVPVFEVSTGCPSCNAGKGKVGRFSSYSVYPALFLPSGTAVGDRQ